MSQSETPQQPNSKRYWGEEKNLDSIYSIYLKKICYTYNNDISISSTDDRRGSLDESRRSQSSNSTVDSSATSKSGEGKQNKHSSRKNNGSAIPPPPPIKAPAAPQSLQWETRQIRILQAATLDHVLKFILLIHSSRDLNSSTNGLDPDGALEEERNNVAHIIHVFFSTYRIYTNPYELMLKLMDYSETCRIEQYRFVMHYWLDNYPEDFEYNVELSNNHHHASFSNKSKSSSISDASSSSSLISEKKQSGLTLIGELLRLCQDEYVRNKALKMSEALKSGKAQQSSGHNQSGSTSRNSAVLDFDSRYVAQQLTAIDLENFLSLRPYTLLEGTKSDKRIQSMIKSFNLLSRHVVVTILKSHNPNIVTAHWIAIAMNLRKIKNFNSLKAIIAGLTNESIYRLKQLIWNKLDRTSFTNFKLLASIVDDVNNQIVLRQTQLIVEGTAKMSIEDDSFGTIPYLGTFLTDLNMIDARYPSYVTSPKDETSKLKLINFEKCAKQFEILTQVQLLQKNVLASLHAIQRRNQFDEQTTLNRLKVEFSQNHQVLLSKLAIPQVARIFENWFYDVNVESMTDKQCYEISVTLEQNVISR